MGIRLDDRDFKYNQSGVSPEGKILGELRPTGIRPCSIAPGNVGFKLGPGCLAQISSMVNSRNR